MSRSSEPEIPILDLPAQLAQYRDAALEAITRVIDAQALILGEEVDTFERELARDLDLPHAIGVSSGTDALLVALMALDIGPGDEVVTTPFSFFATAGTIARLGARPVFADIDPATFNIDPDALAAAITPRTKALLPVHLFGQLADVDALAAHRLPIIEDAAQAIGANLAGRGVGHHGALACLSFYPTKNLGAFGDAGAVLTRDATLAERVRVLRVHGSKPKYHHHLIGGNFRLDAIQAAVLRVKRPLLAGWTQARQHNADRYDALFAHGDLIAAGHVTPPPRRIGEHVFNQYVIRARDRDRLARHLAAHGVGTMVYYPEPLHLQPCFAHLGHRQGDFPEAERACREVLALPVHPELAEGAIERVVEVIRAFYRPPH
ncbi:MAG: DegT/DnrJ/EryC1/StrS family aminotransferase [bacterium]|nr:DegT/DnrJ/EryC1/StrS family aminotransferase [Myxococcales bacterium]